MYLLFDIGGSHIRAAVSKTGKKLDRWEKDTTPPAFADGLQRCIALGTKLLAGEAPQSIIVGSAGLISQDKSVVLHAPNLPQWAKQPLKQQLAEQWHVPVLLENDAVLAGLGEAVKGAGKGRRLVAYLTISTGIGGTRIIDGRVDQASFGFEPGLHFINIAEKPPVTWERLISGRALEEKWHADLAQVTDPDRWDQVAQWLAYGLNNVMAFWSPDIIVLGGGVMKSSVLSLTTIEQYLKDVTTIPGAIPPLARAQLGDTAGLEGGLVKLQQ
jgi:glucokinase